MIVMPTPTKRRVSRWVHAVVTLALLACNVGSAKAAVLPAALPSENQNIVTTAGKGVDNGDGGLATVALLKGVHTVATDSSGNVYIADFPGNRIRKVDAATGIITTVAGTGDAGSSGDGGPATSAQLNGPRGVASDSLGNVYIAEQAGNRIRKVDAVTGIITTVAGTGTAGFSGDGGPATSAQLNGSNVVAVDSSDNLYIDQQSGARVRKVDAVTGIITTVAGTGTAGFSGDGGLATAAKISNGFGGLAFDSSDNLYIGDSTNNRVRKIDAVTGVITTVAGTGTVGFSGDGGLATAANLNLPRGIALDSSDDLYIGDSSNNRIRKVDAVTGIITTVAGTGTAGFSGDGGLATAAILNSPQGVAIDIGGDIYIADNGNFLVRKVDAATGIITTFAGGGTVPVGDGDPAIAAQVNNPIDVIADSSGNLYITENSSQRIRKVDAVTGTITTVAGTGTAGFSGDGGPATSAQIDSPTGICFDSLGNIYFSAVGSQRIRKVSTSGIITTVAGTGATGYNGDGILATSAQLNTPRSVAVDAADNLYISDQQNQRVRKVDAVTGIITTVAGTGTSGFSGDGGQATAAKLNGPRGLAFDSSGNFYIAEQAGHRVRKVDVLTGIITTVAGTGVAGFSGDGGLATAAKINTPKGAAFYSGGLYISDGANSLIRRIDLATGIITTVAGTVAGFSGDGGLATAAQLNSTSGISIDATGDIYFVDNGNNRVRRMNFNATVTLDMASGLTTAYITLPSGRDPNDIDPATVRLQAIDSSTGAVRYVTSASTTTLQASVASGSLDTVMDADNDTTPDTRVLQFDSATVDAWAADTFRVEGQYDDGSYFSGDSRPPAAFTTGAVVTTGGTVVAGKWNASNTGVDVTVPVANDSTLTGGTIQVKANSGSGFVDLGAAYTILVGDLNGDKTLSFTASQLEGIAGFSENDTVSFTAVITDSEGNSTTGATSATTLTVDQVGSGGPVSTPPSVSLFQPNGGEHLTGGSSYQIIWSSNGDGIASFRLALSTNSGSSYSTLATGLTSGSYLWNIPSSLQTSQGRIRVEALNDSGTVIASTASSSDFTVTGTTPPPPSGGGGSTGTPPPTGGEGAGAFTGIEGTDTSSSGQGAMTREEANLQLPPSYPVDALVKLPDDGNPATEVDSTVYYLGLDAKRHPFINAKAYASWYADFSQVQIIDGPTLASIPLGAPILARPGTVWVKIQSDLRTYYVEPGYKLRWIKDEAAARKLGGPDWNQNIVDVDPAFFALYAEGTDIDTSYLTTSWPAGALIDSSLNLQDDRHLLGLRWYVTGGKKRAFVPDSAFGANNFQSRFAWNHAEDSASVQTLDALPSGPDIVGLEDALFSLMH